MVSVVGRWVVRLVEVETVWRAVVAAAVVGVEYVVWVSELGSVVVEVTEVTACFLVVDVVDVVGKVAVVRRLVVEVVLLTVSRLVAVAGLVVCKVEVVAAVVMVRLAVVTMPEVWGLVVTTDVVEVVKVVELVEFRGFCVDVVREVEAAVVEDAADAEVVCFVAIGGCKVLDVEETEVRLVEAAVRLVVAVGSVV